MGDLFFSNYLQFRRNPLDFLTHLARTYGDFVRFHLGPYRTCLLNHPDLVKDVLVTHSHKFKKGLVMQRAKRLLGEGLLTSEGEFHKRQRRLLQPAFHRDHVQAYGAIMTEFTATMRDRWQEGSRLDIAQEMRHLTLAIVSKALFNAEVESEKSEIGKAMTTALELFAATVSPFAELFFYLPLPSMLRLRKAHAVLDGVIFRIIRERKSSPIDEGDLLSMLLGARDIEGDCGGMTDRQVRDEALTLFLAGHETTANALTWTWCLLSQHPEIEQKLHDELDKVLQSRLPTASDLPALTYTRMVFTESLRCYPPAWIIGRTAAEDLVLGGYHIERGTYVLISPYLMHHDVRFYPKPDKFIPERWSPDTVKAQPHYSFFPFGAGPRMCIGESFAWMEGILVIATLAQRWRLRLVPSHPVELQPVITLRPKGSVLMVPERRP